MNMSQEELEAIVDEVDAMRIKLYEDHCQDGSSIENRVEAVLAIASQFMFQAQRLVAATYNGDENAARDYLVRMLLARGYLT